MIRVTSRLSRSTMAALALTALAACDDTSLTNSVSPPNAFRQTNLVADAAGSAARTADANLVNPWGIAFGPTGALWVSNNGTGTSTLYDASGNKLTTSVNVPGGRLLSDGTPTGIVFNDAVLRGGSER